LIRKLSGPHGVGVKRFWMGNDKNHVLVFYPIKKSILEKGYKNPSKKFKLYKNLWGKNEKI